MNNYDDYCTKLFGEHTCTEKDCQTCTVAKIIAKHDSELLDKVEDSITEIYKCNLYCAEDYCDKEKCQNVEDCFYGAISKAIERMKAEINKGGAE